MAGTEAERAALHRQQREARCQWRCHNLRVTLAGDPEARAALGAHWAPVYNAMLEARLPAEPTGPDGEVLCVC